MINSYGANVSTCNTPARILKVSVSPSGVMTVTVVSSYIMLIAVTNSSCIPKAFSIVRIVPLCIVSKAFLKSMNISIASIDAHL